MPGKVKVKIVAGRSLPVMDRSNDTTDAYVEVKLGQITHKTDVCRKSLNPLWNSEWFRFEMDDLELQDEPLQIRLMDYDTYSANDAIGKVYLDLNPLLINSSKAKEKWGKIISGWIPVYDTMHGIRGEVNLIVKVELFSDLNKYRQSSCGVRFFFTQTVPEGYAPHAIQGFVEELVVNDDPEYQWIDKIRTPRASNEARQTLFSKLSGEVQRRVGLKALELGGNAVIGYKQCLDLEGESGIVVRGIGTAIFLTRLSDTQLSPCLDPNGANRELRNKGQCRVHAHLSKSLSLRKSFKHPSSSSPCMSPKLQPKIQLQSTSVTTTTSSTPTTPSIITQPLHLRRNKRPPPLSHDLSNTTDMTKREAEDSDSSSPRPSSDRKFLERGKDYVLRKCKYSSSSTSVDLPLPPFAMLKMRAGRRGSKNKFSTKCLVKRANEMNPGGGTGAGTSSASSLKEEFSKILKRLSLTDSASNAAKKSPYRQPRKFFFRPKRRRNMSSSPQHYFSRQRPPPVRSRSESQSLDHTSSSVESLYDDDDTGNLSEPTNCSSLIEIPTYLSTTTPSPIPQIKKHPPHVDPPLTFSHRKPKPQTSTTNNNTGSTSISAHDACDLLSVAVPSSSTKCDELCRFVQSLGYDTSQLTKPLSLYISSVDALLVYNPLECDCSSGTPTTVEDDDVARKSRGRLYRSDQTVVTDTDDMEDSDTNANEIVRRQSRQRHDTLVGGDDNESCRMTMTPPPPTHIQISRHNNEEHERVLMMSGCGCRSPIPEEFFEATTPTNNLIDSLTNTPPPPLPEPPISINSSSSITNAINITPNGDSNKIPSNKSSSSGSGSSESPNRIIGSKNHPLNRRSSESDLSTPPNKGGSKRGGGSGMGFEVLEMQEFPFITLSQFPQGFIFYLGGTVTARSVKLLDRISNFDEPESRDSWWNEIRAEMRSHCRAFGCTVLLGYEEFTTISDDICILSASGTAAVVVSGSLDMLGINENDDAAQGTVAVQSSTSTNGGDSKEPNSKSTNGNNVVNNTSPSTTADDDVQSTTSSDINKKRHDSENIACAMLHIPRTGTPIPISVKKSRCAICKKGRVPDILLSTLEIPTGLEMTGRSCLIQAQVFRPKKDVKGEASAKEISDSLPFLEYELHRRLINKLKVKGLNAIFGLHVQICLGEKLMVGIATGTAVFLTALPPPNVPQICAGNLKTDSQKVVQFQKVVQEAFDKNREIFRLNKIIPTDNVPQSTPQQQQQQQESSSDGELPDDELPDELLHHRNKDTFVLEVDDAEDIDIITMLIDPSPPVGFNMNNLQSLIGFENFRVLNQQMFHQIWRCRIPSLSLRQFTQYVDRLIRSVTFKLRRMQPCVFSKLSFRIDLPEPDEMQLSIIGMAVGLEKKANTVWPESSKTSSTKGGDEVSEILFPSVEEDRWNGSVGGESVKSASSSPGVGGGNASCSSVSVASSSSGAGGDGFSVRHPHSRPITKVLAPAATKSGPIALSRMHNNWVEISPLSYIHGSRIEQYLGNLNFFFIRETTSLRENGGLSGFVHNMMTEVLAIVRAHVSALGGNAMVSYFMTECALLHNPHKNQGQCVVNVGGDAVFVTYTSTTEEGIS